MGRKLSLGSWFRPGRRHNRPFMIGTQNTKRSGGGAIDERTAHQLGYDITQNNWKRIEACFGWLKGIALLRKLRQRGIRKVG